MSFEKSITNKIYEIVKKIPKGKVATYGQVAKMAGNANLCRVVGSALHKNPDALNIPCHRVVNSKGKLADAFAFGGAQKQAEKLMTEGVVIKNNCVDLSIYGVNW